MSEWREWRNCIRRKAASLDSAKAIERETMVELSEKVISSRPEWQFRNIEHGDLRIGRDRTKESFQHYVEIVTRAEIKEVFK